MNIAFLGDSITFGYGLDDKSKRYSTLVSDALGAEEENYGITGTLVARAGLNRNNGDAFVSRIQLIDKADIAVVFGGTNDYFWSDAPINGDDDGYFAFALKAMTDHIKKERADKLTLFVTPYPHNGVGNFYGGESFKASSRHDTDTRNFNGHVLLDYVKTMKAVCAESGIPCLDLHDGFDFDWRIHTTDGCHPNEEGHRLLSGIIVGKIRSLLSDG